MYLQNVKWQNCEFLSIFLTKEGSNKYKTSLQNKAVIKLTKRRSHREKSCC